MDETALRRRLGAPGVMEAQLERLIELASEPNIALYVVPLQSGYHAAAAGSFSILRFAVPDLPVYSREAADKHWETMLGLFRASLV